MKKSSLGGPSRPVTSSQTAPHANLAATVARHLQHPFRKPFATHNVAAFDAAQAWLTRQQKPLILDSFCGVGESSRQLAAQFPDHAVIGVDKSAHRLNRHAADTELDNYLLVRADVEDFWRLAVNAGWRPHRHYLLYPNPWPKPGQLRYRVQGSAVFPALLKLGGAVELRSNWQIYVEEFHQALRCAGQTGSVERFVPGTIRTPFERKYAAAGQNLWRCRAQLLPGP